jgi:hypothetical protein
LRAADVAVIKNAESRLNAGNMIKWHTQQHKSKFKIKGALPGSAVNAVECRRQPGGGQARQLGCVRACSMPCTCL